MDDPTPCVFCEIVAGTAPATIIREWPDAIAFVPLNPVVPPNGHILVVPRTHVPDAVTRLDVTAATMRRAAELAAGHDASNILTSIGAPATQSVFHLHIHVIRRAVGDQLMVPWGTTGNPHDPHRCKGMDARDDEVERLRAELAEANAAHLAVIKAAHEDGVARAAELERPLPDLETAQLRDDLATALTQWHAERAVVCEHTQVISFGEAADVALAAIEGGAIDRMAEHFVNETRMKSMDFRTGIAMDIEPSRTLVANWVGAARGMLGDAPNYCETPIEMTVKVAEDPEQFVFILQRVAPGTLTPHQARMAAEERADAEVERAEAVRRRITERHEQAGRDFQVNPSVPEVEGVFDTWSEALRLLDGPTDTTAETETP